LLKMVWGLLENTRHSKPEILYCSCWVWRAQSHVTMVVPKPIKKSMFNRNYSFQFCSIYKIDFKFACEIELYRRECLLEYVKILSISP
jgi:hypothetical protein